MAIKQTTKTTTIRGYWARYHQRSILLVCVMQLAVVASLFGAAVATDMVAADDPLVLGGFGGLLALLIVANLMLFHVLMRPLKAIINALAYAANEPGAQRLTNPNQSGRLKPVLETIYNTSVASGGPIQSIEADSPIGEIPVGVAFFDAEGSLLHANSLVPLKDGLDGKQSISLFFQTDPSLQSWLEHCEKNEVHATKTWKRIPSKPLDEPGRKVYDIIASYHKGSSAPLSVVLFDRSDEYSPEDDELSFIAFAAHELRGPITVIHGYLDTLNDELKEVIDSEQQQLFDRLVVSSNRLSGYINNILNSSRYDRRHLHVRLSETRLNDIYESIKDDMSLRASSQGRMISVDLPANLPNVAADTTSIGEVFANLIDNAIKYSYEGGSIEVSAESHDGNSVEIEVVDHGIGMPANVVENLFHKFYRSHRSRETVAGTGIGLYISKAIVESHGGTMQVRSIEGQGSTFSFTLPTYASVADKLAKNDGDNKILISNHSGSWIKNHGAIRG